MSSRGGQTDLKPFKNRPSLVLADGARFLDEQHKLHYCLSLLKGDAYFTMEPFLSPMGFTLEDMAPSSPRPPGCSETRTRRPWLPGISKSLSRRPGFFPILCQLRPASQPTPKYERNVTKVHPGKGALVGALGLLAVPGCPDE